MIKKELNILLTAIMFYTRIPVPKNIVYSPDNLNKATRYFPFIGYVAGGLGALVFIGMHKVLSTNISVISAIAAMVLLTGAFHEDAFADFCDGFGGGYTREKILTIMKDSRIGTYGAAGLSLLFLFKYILLREITPGMFPVILISAHVFSRLVLVIMIYVSQYVGRTEGSKSKPVGEKKSWRTFTVAMIWMVPIPYFLGIKPFLFILPFQVILFVYYRYYIHKKIGGYTGDVLGALQQLSEVLFYGTYLAYCSLS